MSSCQNCPRAAARAFNYHDFGKARGFARNNPGASGGAQAARKTGPVIRMAAAHKRASKVMPAF
jgi:hypothetical protein